MRGVQRGFSLVELMVALTLGLVLFAGVGHLVVASSQSWALQDELRRVRENGRLALDILGQSISTAAYTGCPAQAKLANLLASTTDDRQWMTHFDKGILGIPVGSQVRQQLDGNADSEAIITYRIDSDQALVVNNHNLATSTLTTTGRHGYDQGDLLALTTADCSQVAVFSAGTGTSSTDVTHPAGGGTLANCTSQLQGGFSCHSNATDADTINHEGSTLAALESYAFYLRESNNVPTLYRKLAGEYASGRSISAEALIEGIERLSARYGLDSDGDGVVNQYLGVSELSPYSSQWLSIVSVRLEVVARSFSEVAPQPQAFFFSGQRVVPDDLYVRRSFIRTIKLRNRGL